MDRKAATALIEQHRSPSLATDWANANWLAVLHEQPRSPVRSSPTGIQASRSALEMRCSKVTPMGLVSPETTKSQTMPRLKRNAPVNLGNNLAHWDGAAGG